MMTSAMWEEYSVGGDKSISCKGEVKGIGGFDACLEHSEPIPIGTAEIRALTLDALITAKRAMGRPRDLHAVLELEVIREQKEK